jgi:hypothetical protein
VIEEEEVEEEEEETSMIAVVIITMIVKETDKRKEVDAVKTQANRTKLSREQEVVAAVLSLPQPSTEEAAALNQIY